MIAALSNLAPRLRDLVVEALYGASERCRYSGGFSLVALTALLLAALPNFPGVVVTIKALSPYAVAPNCVSLSRYARFAGFGSPSSSTLLGARLRRTLPNDSNYENT